MGCAHSPARKQTLASDQSHTDYKGQCVHASIVMHRPRHRTSASFFNVSSGGSGSCSLSTHCPASLLQPALAQSHARSLILYVGQRVSTSVTTCVRIRWDMLSCLFRQPLAQFTRWSQSHLHSSTACDLDIFFCHHDVFLVLASSSVACISAQNEVSM